ncbi:MAG TPA: EamA family transporter [Candidatus Krumholzibacteria bacterium]|nr:EamA family transporter [Candidatus Krumholzibacteria bacterium]
MTLGLFALILLAACLHAGWNFFAKRAGGSLTVLWLGAVVSTLATLPVAIAVQWGQPLSTEGVLIGTGSGVIHGVYWWGLARMYRHGDISLAYPIARGSGVMGTAVGAALLVRDPMSLTGVAGIASVSLGVLALGFQRRQSGVRARAVALALLTGASITGYSLIDDQGVEHMSPPVYLAIETGVGAAIVGLAGRRRLRVSIAPMYRAHAATVWIVGIVSPLTYLVILFAYSLGPVGYVVAVREFSVVIAAILGARFLGERIGFWRRAGIALVVAGMVLIKIA